MRNDEDEVEQDERDQWSRDLSRDADPATTQHEPPHPVRRAEHEQWGRDEREEQVLHHVDGVQARLG
jgi:hypothetical protein